MFELMFYCVTIPVILFIDSFDYQGVVEWVFNMGYRESKGWRCKVISVSKCVNLCRHTYVVANIKHPDNEDSRSETVSFLITKRICGGYDAAKFIEKLPYLNCRFLNVTYFPTCRVYLLPCSGELSKWETEEIHKLATDQWKM